VTASSEPARIRWTGERLHADPAFTGGAGTAGPSLFQIYAPDGFAPRWILTTSFPGMEDKRGYADDPEELKAEAEGWLEEFIQSLGAVFLDDIEPLRDDEETAPAAAGTETP
jgi:hypothetical protein